eukprot:15234929-Alexandrium_andersonii.AAC.1
MRSGEAPQPSPTHAHAPAQIAGTGCRNRISPYAAHPTAPHALEAANGKAHAHARTRLLRTGALHQPPTRAQGLRGRGGGGLA